MVLIVEVVKYNGNIRTVTANYSATNAIDFNAIDKCHRRAFRKSMLKYDVVQLNDRSFFVRQTLAAQHSL